MATWLEITLPALAALLAAAAVLFLTALVRTLLVKRRKIEEISVSADPETSGRAAESLGKLIGFKTVSGQDEREFEKLHAYLEQRYPRAHADMKREQVGLSLIYRWPSPEPKGDPLLFCAHLDVVPVSGEWEHEPFSGEIVDGCVFGRGAIDCKNVVACLMEAAEALCAEGFSPDRDIYFAFGQDEETGGELGAGRISELFEKAGLRFSMVLDEGNCISRGDMGIEGPVAKVGVSEKGFLNFTMTAISPGGHASTPPCHTAIGVVSEAVCRLEYGRRRAVITPVVSDQLEALAPYLPFSYRFMIKNLWLCKPLLLKRMSKDPAQNAMIRTTLACTMAQAGTAPNVLPAEAKVTCNCRPRHGDSCREVLRQVGALTNDLGVEVQCELKRDPSGVSDYTGPAFAALKQTIGEVFGPVPVTPCIMSGGTDARKYERLCTSVFRFMPFALTPFDLARMHARNESVRMESLGPAVDFYKKLMRKLSSGDKV